MMCKFKSRSGLKWLVGAGILGLGLATAKIIAEKRKIQKNLKTRPVVSHLELLADTEPDFNSGSVFFVGNATVIIRYAGFAILTDPNFLHMGDHAHIGYGLVARRLTNPAIEIEELPHIDLVLLSHMHEDHFDRIAKEKLDRSLPIITTKQASKRLEKWGFGFSYGLEKWESVAIRKGSGKLGVTALPGKHGPGPTAHLLPYVNGNLLEFGNTADNRTFRIYISGDTLPLNGLKDIPRQFPDIDLALIHLGGTQVLGLTVTMDAQQGVKTLSIIAPHEAIPIHYNDYDRFKSSLNEFKQAVEESGLMCKIHYLAAGETFTFYPENKEG